MASASTSASTWSPGSASLRWAYGPGPVGRLPQLGGALHRLDGGEVGMVEALPHGGGTSLELIAIFHGRCWSGGDSNLSGAGVVDAPGWSHHWRNGGHMLLAKLTVEWSHAAGGR